MSKFKNGAIVEDATATLQAAIQADIGDFSAQSNLTSLLAALGIPDTSGKPLYTCLITDRLDNGTYGLSALKTVIDTKAASSTALTNATWTDARAGYLDNLSAGAVALAANQLTDATWTDTRAAYLDHLVAADTASTHDITTANDQTETDMFSISATTMYQLSVYVDVSVLVTAVEGGTVTFRLYNKIDETNYREIATTDFVVGTTTTHPSFEVMMCNHNSKLTIQCGADVTETRTINYRYITRPIE